MNKRCLITFVIIFTFFIKLFGQNELPGINIKGKLIDENTGLPIEYACVYIKSTQQGIVSNSEGKFQLKVLASVNDSLAISCVGYQSVNKSIGIFLNSREFILKMKPSIYLLNEISIKAPPIAKEIINKAKDKLDENYTQNPFMADCYFSELVKEDGKYVRAMELALLQYNKGGLQNPLLAIPFQQIKIIQKRKSANNSMLADSPLNHNFSMHYQLILSNLRYYFYRLKNFNFTIDSISEYENEPVYIISGKYETESMTYYISKNNFKVIQIEFHSSAELPKYRMNSFYFSVVPTYGKLQFKEANGKMYPLYTQINLQIKYYQNKSDTAFWHIQNIFSELLYSNIITENLKEISKQDRLELLSFPNIYKMDIPYSEEFWNKFNYLEESNTRKNIYDSINNNIN